MRRILVGYDGSAPAHRALRQACVLAERFQGSICVMTGAADRLSTPQHHAMALELEPGRSVAEAGAQFAREWGVSQVEVRTSIEAPDDALVLEASDGYDLVVVGHRSSGPIRERLLGSVAKSVLDRAPCSVLVVR